MTKINIYNANCFEWAKTQPENSIDVIVTDPPYGIDFMGKQWDDPENVMNADLWKELLRILKPGGHLLSFADKNKQHRLHVAIEDAGFIARDTFMWLYGSGFPKGQKMPQLIDKHHKFVGKVIGTGIGAGTQGFIGKNEDGTNHHFNHNKEYDIRTHHPDALVWDGWQTPEVKPAYEPILWFTKKYEKTLANNCLKYGVGAVNIDGNRVGDEMVGGHHNPKVDNIGGQTRGGLGTGNVDKKPDQEGRFPANILHDGSDEVLKLFPYTKSGKLTPNHKTADASGLNGIYNERKINVTKDTYGDSGSAARFFYNAKASKGEREKYCIGLAGTVRGGVIQYSRATDPNVTESDNTFGINKPKERLNIHPTVKPFNLMKHFISLFAPKGARILDPFMGSATTGISAIEMDRDYHFIGIELDKDYYDMCMIRLKNAKAEIDPEFKQKLLDSKL